MKKRSDYERGRDDALEEIEGSLCPEDVGIDEYVASLRAKIKSDPVKAQMLEALRDAMRYLPVVLPSGSAPAIQVLAYGGVRNKMLAAIRAAEEEA